MKKVFSLKIGLNIIKFLIFIILCEKIIEKYNDYALIIEQIKNKLNWLFLIFSLFWRGRVRGHNPPTKLYNNMKYHILLLFLLQQWCHK